MINTRDQREALEKLLWRISMPLLIGKHSSEATPTDGFSLLITSIALIQRTH